MTEALVTIERMCYGGAGFGRVAGKACFVPFTAPGDRARVRIVREKRSYLEAELLELESSSPLRVEPPCPFFGSCGGCDWQHLPYEEQLKQKGEIFAGNLSRIGRVEGDFLLPVAGSPKQYGYRSRIQLKVALKKGTLSLGFFRTGSHEVIDLGSVGCAISDPLLNRIYFEFRAQLPRCPDLAAISQIDLSLGDDGDSIAIVHYSGKNPAKLMERLAAARRELPSVHGLFLRCGAKGKLERIFGIDSLSYAIPADLVPGSAEMRLRFGRGGFSQVNYLQNLELVRTVWQWGGFSGTERVLDLFCGNGNISLPIAPYVAEVVGVEGYAPSIEDARANAAANGIANATFLVSDALKAVRHLDRQGDRFDLVILDPPRGGAEGAGEIATLKPDKIIYVSCDPATLSRDLAQICEKGYRVTRSKPVDMFPQTYHLESVTELTRL
jgi:23S rRNA (uracil1939-C5)-methyltransferase